MKKKYAIIYTRFYYAGGSSSNHLGVSYGSAQGCTIVELTDDELTDENIDKILNKNDYSNAPRSYMIDIKKLTI